MFILFIRKRIRYYHPYFMGEDTEHQKGELLVQGQTARTGENGIQIALTPELLLFSYLLRLTKINERSMAS